jgi:hypothetical protein
MGVKAESMSKLRLQATRSTNSASFIKAVSERVPDLQSKQVKRLKQLEKVPEMKHQSNGDGSSGFLARLKGSVLKFLPSKKA